MGALVGVRVWVFAIAVAMLASLGGCKKASRAIEQFAAKLNGHKAVPVGEAPSGSLVGAQYRFRAAVYHVQAQRPDVRAIVERLAAGKIALLADDAAAEKATGASVVIGAPTLADYAPPEKSTLQYFGRGLSPEDEEALLASKSVTVLSFRGPGAQAAQQYRAALELVGAVVGEVGGYPWDEEARLVFTGKSWAGLLEHWQDGEPQLNKHVALHAYRDGELIRIVSLGMVKFALPDLAVNQVSGDSSGSMSSLANLVCQTLYEQGKLGSDGHLVASIDALKHAELKAELSEDLKNNAKRRVEVQLATSKPAEGDSDNRLLEIAFPGTVSTLQERQSAALSELFGAHDSIVNVKHDDELLAASERARKKALIIGKRYVKGPPFGEQLLVKAPFDTTAGGTEWMWVEVVSWNGNEIDGILKNDPFDVPSLKDGSRVEVQASKIFDYILKKKDGSSEGNETGVILQAREKDGADVREK